MSYLTVFFSEMEHILYLSPHLGCLRHPGVKLPVYNILYNRYSTCTLYSTLVNPVRLCLLTYCIVLHRGVTSHTWELQHISSRFSNIT